MTTQFRLYFSDLCTFNLLFQYKFANHESNSQYASTGKASLRFQLINQRADFSFALFSGGLANVCSWFFVLFICFIDIPIIFCFKLYL